MLRLSVLAFMSALATVPAVAEEIPRVLSAEEQAAQAADQPNCLPFRDAIKVLAEQFHEVPQTSMLSDEGMLIAIFATRDGATFTMVTVRPDGLSCILAAGTTFAIAPAPKAPGVES